MPDPRKLTGVDRAQIVSTYLLHARIYLYLYCLHNSPKLTYYSRKSAQTETYYNIMQNVHSRQHCF